jgi:methylenetetrahydrofolate reductase (NADPH)
MTRASTVPDLLEHPRFELVPLRGVEEEAGHLPAGATVTVTCSPRRGIEATVELARRLAGRGFRAVPHLAARLIHGPGHLEELAGRLVTGGVEEVFVIGGDPPEPVGPYRAAIDVIEGLDALGRPFDPVGIGGYPERHPFIGPDELLDALLDKQALAGYIVTQICFEPDRIFAWLEDIRARGVTLPVHVGLPGAVSRRRLLEIALKIGVGDSIRYLTKHGSLVARMMRRASYRPDAVLAGLSQAPPGLGIAGLHLNTFNQVRSTERWRRRALADPRWTGAVAFDEDETGA